MEYSATPPGRDLSPGEPGDRTSTHDRNAGDLSGSRLHRAGLVGGSRYGEREPASGGIGSVCPRYGAGGDIAVIALSKNGPDAALTAPADTRGEAREPKAPPTWAAAGAVFLTAFLVCGAGFSQNPPTAEDSPVSPMLRQGTIHEEELSSPGREPVPAVRETAPAGNPEPAPPRESSTEAAPVPTAPAADPDIDAGRVASDEPDRSYELPPLSPVAGVAVPQRRASMKLVQQGRALLRDERYKAALGRFEQAVGLDAANPYSHYFIARAHYLLEQLSTIPELSRSGGVEAWGRCALARRSPCLARAQRGRHWFSRTSRQQLCPRAQPRSPSRIRADATHHHRDHGRRPSEPVRTAVSGGGSLVSLSGPRHRAPSGASGSL